MCPFIGITAPHPRFPSWPPSSASPRCSYNSQGPQIPGGHSWTSEAHGWKPARIYGLLTGGGGGVSQREGRKVTWSASKGRKSLLLLSSMLAGEYPDSLSVPLTAGLTLWFTQSHNQFNFDFDPSSLHQPFLTRSLRLISAATPPSVSLLWRAWERLPRWFKLPFFKIAKVTPLWIGFLLHQHEISHMFTTCRAISVGWAIRNDNTAYCQGMNIYMWEHMPIMV